MALDAVRQHDFGCFARAGMKLQLLPTVGVRSAHADFQDKSAYPASVG
jgi:hypothetical protein